LRFRVIDFDVAVGSESGFMSIEGTLLNEEEERELEKSAKSGINGSSLPHRSGKQKAKINGVASSSNAH
jgi:hypothetical protein